MSKTQVRKKGFSFLSFFLGFLFGIIVLVGAVAGVVIFALKTDLDTLLSTFGVDNSKDEEGNNKVVNTDPENGGVTSVMELLQAVAGFATDYQTKTIADVEALLPVASGLVDSVYDMVNQYVSVDKEEIKAVKFAEFGTYLSEVVYDIQPASFFDSVDNAIVEALLCGVDADYVEVSGVKYPVWYDDADVYFYKSGESNYYVVENSDGEYTVTSTTYTYNEETAHLTGNFYYENGDMSGEKIVVSPITIGTFVNGGDLFAPLKKVMITDFIGGDDGGVVDKILGDVSIGDLMGGEFNFDDKINTLKIGDIIEVGENKILNAIGDCTLKTIPERMETIKINELVDVECNKILEAIGECTLDSIPERMETIKINELVDVEGNKILEAIGECTLDSIPERMETIKINELVDVEGNKILEAIGECTLDSIPERMETIKINELVDVEGNKILEAIGECTLSDIPTKMETLTIGELVEVGDNKILKALEFCTLSGIPDRINELMIGELIDTENNKILTALSTFKISELSEGINSLKIGDLVEVGESNILKAIADCTIADLPTEMNKLTLGQVLGEIDVNNKLLYALKGAKITEIGAEIDKLSINDLYADYETDDEGKKVPTGMWKLLLCKYDATTEEYVEQEYKLNDFGALISNVTDNMKTATLSELHEAEILIFEDETTLTKPINGKPLGEYTVTGALETLTAIIP